MALQWGICGAGKISNDFCAAMLTLPKDEHNVVAIASKTPGKGREFADRFGYKNAKIYGSYEDLAADSNVEVAYIGTYTANHVEMCLMMINAGKHVLCEVPMAMNLQGAQKVLGLAKQKQLFFMEGFKSRMFPVYDHIKKDLHSVGDVKMVTSTFTYWCANAQEFKNNLGEGILNYIGLFNVQFATLVFDEMPEKIVTEGVMNDDNADMQASVILRYKNGALASLNYSALATTSNNSAVIHGTKGSIEVPDFFWAPSEVTTPSGHYTNDIPESDLPFNYPNGGGQSYEADCVRRCIRQGHKECPLMTHRHSEIIRRIMDEIYKQQGVTFDSA